MFSLFIKLAFNHLGTVLHEISMITLESAKVDLVALSRITKNLFFLNSICELLKNSSAIKIKLIFFSKYPTYIRKKYPKKTITQKKNDKLKFLITRGHENLFFF